MSLMKRWPWLNAVIAALSFLFFSVTAAQWLSFRREMKRMLADHTKPNDSRAKLSAPDKGIEARLNEASKKAGVKQLLGVSAREGSGAKTISIEWEATQNATLAYLVQLQNSGTVGACGNLLVSPASSSPELLNVRAVFDEKPFDLTGPSSIEVPRLARNVFAPLWRDAAAGLAERQERDRKKAEADRLAQQDRSEKDRLAQQEVQQQQAKKRDLESQWVVTGIVNNGHEPLAFVNAPNGGRSMMLHGGDMVNEARVTAIDEKRGEVRLNYLGKFDVVLKLNSNSAGTP